MRSFAFSASALCVWSSFAPSVEACSRQRAEAAWVAESPGARDGMNIHTSPGATPMSRKLRNCRTLLFNEGLILVFGK